MVWRARKQVNTRKDKKQGSILNPAPKKPKKVRDPKFHGDVPALVDLCKKIAPRWLEGVRHSNEPYAELLQRLADPASLETFDVELEAARSEMLGLHHHVRITPEDAASFDVASLFITDAVRRGGLVGATRALLGSAAFEIGFPAGGYVNGKWSFGSALSLRRCRNGLEWVGFRNGDTGPWNALREQVALRPASEAELAADAAAPSRMGSMTAACAVAFVFSFRDDWVEDAITRWEHASQKTEYPVWDGYCLLEVTTDPSLLSRVARVVGRSFPSNELGFASWSRTLERFADRLGDEAAPLLTRMTPRANDFEDPKERRRVLAVYQHAMKRARSKGA